MAAGEGLLRNRRRDRLRAAHQDRAAWSRRGGESPLREGATAQGVLPQRSGTEISRRVLEDLELPHRTARTAPRRRKVAMSDVEKSRFISKVIGDKKRWRAYKARTRRLPENYRTVVEAIERCLMYFVPTNAGSAASMFEDLADLFEQAAADGTPIREIVGEDPVEFVDAFARNYSE